MNIFCTTGPDLLIIASDEKEACEILNNYNVADGEIPFYVYVPSDFVKLSPLNVPALAPGYLFSRRYFVNKAASEGRLFMTRGF